MPALTSRPRRSAFRRALGVLGCVAFLLGAGAHPARAARVTVLGASACVDADATAEQASDLLGRRLADIPGIDFEINLSRRGPKWHLRLDTVETDPAGGPPLRRSRELQAATCTELGDAAAVGIAMSVRALVEAERPAPEVPPATVSVSPPPPAPSLPLAEPASPTRPGRSAVAGRVALVGDAGSLPGPTIGVELGAGVRLSWVRIGASGTVLIPRDKQVTPGVGGEVDLAYGALEICAPDGDRRIEVFVCGGFELGRLAAKGTGIMQPRLGSVLWETVRADVGVALPLRAGLRLALRAGAGVPLSRPQFVLNGTTLVHRPAAVVARAAAGVELEF